MSGSWKAGTRCTNTGAAGVALEGGLVGQRVERRVGVLDEAAGREHALPVDQQLEGGAAVEEHRDEEQANQNEPVAQSHSTAVYLVGGAATARGNFSTVSPSRT